MHETLMDLLRDRAHWEFELILMVIFDGLIGLIIWPFIKKHVQHHLDRDRRDIVQNWGTSCAAQLMGHVGYVGCGDIISLTPEQEAIQAAVNTKMDETTKQVADAEY